MAFSRLKFGLLALVSIALNACDSPKIDASERTQKVQKTGPASVEKKKDPKAATDFVILKFTAANRSNVEQNVTEMGDSWLITRKVTIPGIGSSFVAIDVNTVPLDKLSLEIQNGVNSINEPFFKLECSVKDCITGISSNNQTDVRDESVGTSIEFTFSDAETRDRAAKAMLVVLESKGARRPDF